MMELSIRSHLEVAHYMDHYPEGHQNRRVHGHSYYIELSFKDHLNSDVVVDYEMAQKSLENFLKDYCHSSINDWDLPSQKATMENMCRFFWPKLKNIFPKLCRVTLERPTLGMKLSFEGEE